MKWKWDTDRIVSLSAMVVGVGSLAIILYQTKLMREQQRASVMPYLMMAVQSSTNDHRTYLTVRNAGIGPALLGDVRVRYKGKDFAGDAYDFFVQQRPEIVKTMPMGVDKLIPGRLVPAGEWIMTMGSDGEQHTTLLAELLRLFVIAEVPKSWLTSIGADGPASDKAVVFITYSSVYGDIWHLRSDSFVPVPGPVPGLP
ncbi:MAG TPA: hypothetical protein VFO31_12295 [Vicinamibacterales bacterium]|nr:hypothetical protein [Vicinamibacterales bacterium]